MIQKLNDKKENRLARHLKSLQEPSPPRHYSLSFRRQTFMHACMPTKFLFSRLNYEMQVT